ncbi:glycosyltransferase family 39 protein [Nucisporomicrobium flavum]|uniref:glycosyltransferase family 39 protein n=1 Tax=Nucisporomicrobium flavum TaxID=2785915 RepID=UPI0018F2A4E1|nr:glycosyltransferase family 39 protein [Nucisporomicrobium flavum]
MTVAAPEKPQVARIPGAHEPRRTGPAGWTAWLALLPAVVIAAVSLIGADQREMWEDEYATYHAISITWSELGRLFTHLDIVHALYYVLMRGWIAVAGDSLTALRIPSIAALALTGAIVVLIGRRLVSTPVGVVAGLLLAVIPAFSRYAQEVRSYALVTLLATLSTYLLLRALERPVGRRWAAWAAVTAVTGLVHFMGITVVGGQLLYLLLATSRTDEVRRWRFAGALGAVVLVVIPLPAMAQHQSSQVSWIRADLDTARAFLGRVFLSTGLAWVLVPLALLGAVMLWQRNRPATAMLLAWSAGPIVFGYVTVSVLHLFVGRYMLFTLPAWALLAATAICHVARPLGRRPHGTWWVLGAALALPGLTYLSLADHREVRESPVGGQPDYRTALYYVRDHAQAKDGIVYNDKLGGRSDLARAAAEYELRDGGPKDVLLYRTAGQTGYFGAAECPDPAPCLSGNNRLWLVSTSTSKNAWDGMKPAAADILSKNFQVKEDKRFPMVRVVLLVRTGAAKK